jgi:hypothetical protein
MAAFMGGTPFAGLGFSDRADTLPARPPPGQPTERRFLAPLAAVRAFRREADRLLLLDEAARIRLRLAPLP